MFSRLCEFIKMKEKGNILNNFILKIVQEENASNVQLVTKQNISVLVKLFENKMQHEYPNVEFTVFDTSSNDDDTINYDKIKSLIIYDIEPIMTKKNEFTL